MDQPLLILSHHGRYAIATVGRIENLDALAARVLARPGTHFAELRGDEVNPTDLVAGIPDSGVGHALGYPSARGRSTCGRRARRSSTPASA